jgi:hypothetical protein
MNYLRKFYCGIALILSLLTSSSASLGQDCEDPYCGKGPSASTPKLESTSGAVQPGIRNSTPDKDLGRQGEDSNSARVLCRISRGSEIGEWAMSFGECRRKNGTVTRILTGPDSLGDRQSPEQLPPFARGRKSSCHSSAREDHPGGRVFVVIYTNECKPLHSGSLRELRYLGGGCNPRSQYKLGLNYKLARDTVHGEFGLSIQPNWHRRKKVACFSHPTYGSRRIAWHGLEDYPLSVRLLPSLEQAAKLKEEEDRVRRQTLKKTREIEREKENRRIERQAKMRRQAETRRRQVAAQEAKRKLRAPYFEALQSAEQSKVASLDDIEKVNDVMRFLEVAYVFDPSTSQTLTKKKELLEWYFLRARALLQAVSSVKFNGDPEANYEQARKRLALGRKMLSVINLRPPKVGDKWISKIKSQAQNIEELLQKNSQAIDEFNKM